MRKSLSKKHLLAFWLMFPILFLFPALAKAEWQTVCQKDSCMLNSQIVNTASGKVLARISMRRLTEADANTLGASVDQQMMAVLFLPLGIHLPTGVTVSIKENTGFKADLLDCTQQYGCRATFVLKQDALEKIGKQKALTVSVVLTESAKAINYAFLLEGFSDHIKNFHTPKL